MSEGQDSAASEAAQRQVRVQLTSKQEDIALPESTGPILVPTGKNVSLQQSRLARKLTMYTHILFSTRSATLCAFNIGE